MDLREIDERIKADYEELSDEERKIFDSVDEFFAAIEKFIALSVPGSWADAYVPRYISKIVELADEAEKRVTGPELRVVKKGEDHEPPL